MNSNTNWVRLSVFSALTILLFAGTLHAGGLYIKSWTMPWREDIRREAYEETRSHVEGVTQDILRYRVKYQETENEEQREALRGIILRKAATLDEGELSKDVRDFVDELKAQRKAER